MAAAAISSSAIDWKAQATFPVRLGNSISNPTEAPQYTSVRYNHKPQLKRSESVRAHIHEGSEAGKSRLSIDAQDGEYSYSGRYGHHEETFVLVVRGHNKEKELILERTNSSHSFNLDRTPTEADASKLASQYPELQDDLCDDDLFGDDDEDMPPDDSNPFDYRHFLKAELDKAEKTNANLDAARSTAPTPVVQPRPATNTPAPKLLKRTETKPQPPKKRKTPAAAEKSNPKRVKAGQEPPPPIEASRPKTKPKPEVPTISLDRKASLRRQSLDDSGELIIENETPDTEKPPRQNAMALALNNQLGSGPLRTGPISLQSAANSPASHVASPALARPEDAGEEEYVFEFDDEPEPQGQLGDDEDAEGEEEVDADVEDLELPSPAQAHRPSVTAQSVAGAGDEDDDLDQQLAAAMMEEDQESEESEEE